MDSWIQKINKAQRREGDKKMGTTRPFLALVLGSNPNTEKVQVQHFGGVFQYATRHPYVGLSSWIRVSPEKGGGVFMQRRDDIKNTEIVGYAVETPTPVSVHARIQSYYEKAEAYRPLQPGEIEISSPGLAQTFYSSRAQRDTRAGILKGWKDQDRLEDANKSPIHRRMGYQHQSNTIKDEERFGVVARPDGYIKRDYIKKDGEFAKEYLRQLSFEGTPNILTDFREGHVIDDQGNEISSSVTGKNLRARGRWFNNSSEATVAEIDEDGNLAITLPQGASEGAVIKIPAGNFKVSLGGEADIRSRGNLKIQTDLNAIIQAAVKATIKAANLELSTNTALPGNILTTSTAVSHFSGQFILPGVPALQAN